MCGIFGFIDFEGAPVDNSSLRNVADALFRRGPDEEGIFTRQAGNITVALLHRRLKIIDLETGKQPMANESGDIVLVCNGEIYNYKELREELLAKGHHFRSRSDSEVIIHAYEEYSFDCLQHFRGMFAFAIWDNKNSLLFIARDRVGKKPIFYYTDEVNRVMFSSQINALLKYSTIPRDVDRKAIYQYLSYGYIPAPQTSFKAIKKLNPAHYLVFHRNKLNIVQYWNLDFSQKISTTEDKAAQEVNRLVNESIKLRMISDVPVGAFLSGGLDSSIVVGLMSKATALPVETFSVGFNEEGYSELNYARTTQKFFGCSHHDIIMKPESFLRLPNLIEYLGEPHADSSALATMVLAEEAQKKITVALVGEGADELFGGYKRYLYYRLRGYFDRIFPAQRISFARLYKRWMGGINDRIMKTIAQHDFSAIGQDKSMDKEFFNFFFAGRKLKDIDGAMFTDMMFFLPYDLLVKLDVSTMAYGVEARAPFLDHKLIEFITSLPSKIKLKGFISKYILREAFKDMLPLGIPQRKKTGFVVPVKSWFRNELKDTARDILLSSSAKKRGYFNIKAIGEMLDSHINGKSDFGQEIWTLLVFELWHRRFLDEKF